MAQDIKANGEQRSWSPQPNSEHSPSAWLPCDEIAEGDASELIDHIQPNSIALSAWSPPYFVGKSYEKDLSYEGWLELLRTVIAKHHAILKPGGFLAINSADILCFPDPSLPRIQAENFGGNRLPVTREDVLRAWAEHPHYNRFRLPTYWE